MGFENTCIPDLSKLNVPLMNCLLAQLLVGIVKNDRKGLYMREYVRLVDKAVFEYELSRQALEAQKEDTGQLHFLLFIDHFETCINAMRRLLKLLDGIKGLVSTDSETSRYLRKLIRFYGKSAIDIRNQIEHMAEDIGVGRIQDGKPVMLLISDDGKAAFVGNSQIQFDSVAACLRYLHHFAVILLDEGSESKIPVEQEHH
jgi:hypothetical protein